jgi:hypothetical protein
MPPATLAKPGRAPDQPLHLGQGIPQPSPMGWRAGGPRGAVRHRSGPGHGRRGRPQDRRHGDDRRRDRADQRRGGRLQRRRQQGLPDRRGLPRAAQRGRRRDRAGRAADRSHHPGPGRRRVVAATAHTGPVTFVDGHARTIICSDGLTGVLAIDQLRKCCRPSDLDELVQGLLAVVYDAGAPDNVSIIAADLHARFVVDAGAMVACYRRAGRRTDSMLVSRGARMATPIWKACQGPTWSWSTSSRLLR